MENGDFGIELRIHEANLCLKLCGIAWKSGYIKAVSFLNQKDSKYHYIENLASKKSHATIFGV